MSGRMNQALDEFQGVKNIILRWILLALPWFILVLILVIVIILKLTSNLVMFITGMVTAAISLFAFQYLMKLIPRTLCIIWNRKIITNDVSDVSREIMTDLVRKIMANGYSHYKVVANSISPIISLGFQ